MTEAHLSFLDNSNSSKETENAAKKKYSKNDKHLEASQAPIDSNGSPTSEKIPSSPHHSAGSHDKCRTPEVLASGNIICTQILTYVVMPSSEARALTDHSANTVIALVSGACPRRARAPSGPRRVRYCFESDL